MHDWWTFQNLYHGPLVEPITEVAKPYGDFCSDFQATVDTYNAYLIHHQKKEYRITAELPPSDFVDVLNSLINCASPKELAKEAIINMFIIVQHSNKVSVHLDRGQPTESLCGECE